MEENRADEEESTQSETPPTKVGDLSQNRRSECDEPQTLQEREKVLQAASGAPDGEADHSQESLTGRNTPDAADCLPQHLPEASPVSASSYPPSAQNHPSEPCWYCLRSLDSEFRPQVPAQQDTDPFSSAASGGQNVNYQTDPRPHFGVACSSHSPCRPLWGSEGPCWGHRDPEVAEQMRTCPHCHLGLPRDTLRWHEAKCLLFEGLRKSKT